MKIQYNLNTPAKIKRKDLVIFACILVLAIIVNLFILSFAYLSQNKTATGTITLGEVDFSIAETQQTNLKVLPSVTIPKTVYIGNYRDSNPSDYRRLASIFFRFKIDVLLDNNINTELTNSISLSSDAKFYYDNKYFYYCAALNAGEKINLCENLTFANFIDNKYQQKQIQLQFSVDAIQSQHDAYKEVWPDYPPEWEQMIL